ncbi:MAG: choice-of-anchor L domain-containing protein [Cellulophaga sp.]
MKRNTLYCILLFSIGINAQITVDDSSYTTQQLIEDILIGSKCANTTNWNSGTGSTTNSALNGIGYFNKNGSDFPFAEGVIISTGSAIEAPGPNNTNRSDGALSTGIWGGDSDLSTITNTSSLSNASFIEFDFTPKASSVSFNFIFASEEYLLDYPCNFSDVFAFILTDENGLSKNLAIIPNTNTPIKVTSIRPDIYDPTNTSVIKCNAVNSEYFNGYNPVNSSIDFNGQTTIFNASAEVIPNKTYHIKLVIADSGDGEFDSAVFIEAGSFKSSVNLGDDRLITTNNPVCTDLTLEATTPSAIGYKWYRDGIELTAENNPILVTNISGNYGVEVDMGAGCVFQDDVEVEFVKPPLFTTNLPVDIFKCEIDGDNSEVFDFTDNTALMLGTLDSNTYHFSYFTKEIDATNNENPILNTSAYVSGSKKIYARMWVNATCFEIASFNLEIVNPGIVNSLDPNYNLCLDATGNAIFPLVLDIAMDTTLFNFQWYTGKEAIAGQEIIGATQATISVTNLGDFTLKATNKTYGCEFVSTTNISGVSPPTKASVRMISELFIEKNKIEVLVEGISTYEYRLDDGTYQNETIFSDVKAGEHIVYIRDIFQCTEIERQITIVDFPKYFTPNGDPYNDRWSLKGLESLNNYIVSIYDRYGKLLFQFDKNNTDGWDGIYNGKNLPEDDYWFKINYTDDKGFSKIYSNHFSLKR